MGAIFEFFSTVALPWEKVSGAHRRVYYVSVKTGLKMAQRKRKE
jgi:hypothetical protein